MRVDAIGLSGLGLEGIGIARGRPLPFAMVAFAAMISLGCLPFALRRRLMIGFRTRFFGKGDCGAVAKATANKQRANFRHAAFAIDD